VTPNGRASIAPKYDLDPDQFTALEKELVDDVRGGGCSAGITAVWLGPEHRYAKIFRTHDGMMFV
jgi:hypothetical protein